MFKELFTESKDEDYLKVLIPDDKLRADMTKWFNKWNNKGLYQHIISEKMVKKFKGKTRESNIKEFVSRLYEFPATGPGQFD